MPISVRCQCGRTLKIDEKHRGKKAKCPECGNLVLVEEAETGMQAERPRAKASNPFSTDDTGERKPLKKPAKSNMMLYLAGGGCAGLLLLTCCLSSAGVGAWYLWFRGPEADLAYVHEGCAGFVSVRVADVWKSAVVQDNLKQMPADRKKKMDDEMKDMETKLGMKVEDLERATFIARSADLQKPEFIAVLKTSKAMDSKRIVEAIGNEQKQKANEVKHDGKTFYVFAGRGDGMVVCFVTDRIVVMSNKENTLRDALSSSRKPATNPALTRGIAMAGSGKHHVVAAYEVKKNAFDNMFPPGMMDQKAVNVLKANGVIVAGTLAKDLALEGVLTFATKDDAGKAKSEVDGFVTLGKMFLNDPKAPPAFGKALDSIKVEQSGSDVVVKAKIDLDMKGFGGIPGMGFGFGGGLGGGGGPVRGAQQMQSSNNLKQIILAMHSFHDVYKALPNQAIRHPQTGTALLSWRVALLPYIEQQALYNQIKKDEAWDSAHNRQFWNQMPAIYQLPGRPKTDRTHYQVFFGPESAFPGTKRMPVGNPMIGDVRLQQIADGASNTILVVEAQNPVNWMAPNDIIFDAQNPVLTGNLGILWGNNTVNAGMGDGAVRTIRRSLNVQTLRALVTRAGGEVINDADLQP